MVPLNYVFQARLTSDPFRQTSYDFARQEVAEAAKQGWEWIGESGSMNTSLTIQMYRFRDGDNPPEAGRFFVDVFLFNKFLMGVFCPVPEDLLAFLRDWIYPLIKKGK